MGGVLRSAGPFTLALGATFTETDGTVTPVAAGDLAATVAARLLEGVAGRVTALLGAEKARIRRELRVVAASRRIATARAGALDRVGAELGVRRFGSALAFDPVTKSVSVTHLDAGGAPILETDAAYRRRLAIYRPMLRANATATLRALGLDGIAGFGLDESNDDFAITLCTIGVGGAYRDNFLAHVRATYLTWLERTPAADAVHAARFIPAAQAGAVTDLRTRVAGAFTLPANAAVAPVLASVLDTIAKAGAALGMPAAWKVTRAQDPAAGSRYELGLGADLARPAAADLAAAAARLRDPTFVPAVDRQLAGVLAGMRASLDADGEDPAGAWFFGPCGARTVHELDPGDDLHLAPACVGARRRRADQCGCRCADGVQRPVPAPGGRRTERRA